MEKVKGLFGYLLFVFSLIFGTFFKHVFIIFPLVTIDISFVIRVIGCLVLVFICSIFPVVYHIVSIILFAIGMNYLYQFPAAFVIIYYILFLLIIIEALRVLSTFIILCMSK